MRRPSNNPFAWHYSARVLLVIVLGFCAVLMSACRVDATIDVAVTDDGSGTVTVVVKADAEAAKRIGDPTKAIRTDDMTKAGWVVAAPKVNKDSGELVLSATRRFASSKELAEALADIGSGADGPFISGVKVGLKDSFARTEYSFAGELKMSGAVDELSDPALTEVLGGLPVGRTPEELTALGLGKDGLGTLRVRVDLPGDVGDHTGKKVGDAIEWSAPIASGTAVSEKMSVESVSTQRQVQLFRVLGFGLLIAAIGLGVVGVLRRR